MGERYEQAVAPFRALGEQYKQATALLLMTTWDQQAYVKAANTGADDSFGHGAVAL